MSNPEEFKCRFRPLNRSIPPKYINARYFNDTTILCASPGGWGDVEAVNVDVTFNGVDYTPNAQTFRFYNVASAKPRSGPAAGGTDVIVSGLGFKTDGRSKCKIDGVEVDAVETKWDEIKCKIPAARLGPKFSENVPFEVSVNGDEWHEFVGGFTYYPQPEVERIYPQFGPNIGRGKIRFYGSGFKEDTQTESACKIGDAYGKA